MTEAVEKPLPAPLQVRSDATGRALGKTFISYASALPETSSGKCVAFRKEIKLARASSDLVLHLFVDARYLLWINGKFVGRGPGRFEPIGPEYDSIPVGQFMHAGTNLIAVLVSGRISNGQTRWRPIGLTARLQDGARNLAKTDESWKWSDRTRYRKVSVDWANIYDTVDFRVEDGDWTQPNYGDYEWANARYVAPPTTSLAPRTRVDDRDVVLDVVPMGNSWWGPLSKRRTPLLAEKLLTPKWEKPLPITLEAGQKLKFHFNHLVLATTHFSVTAEANSELRFSHLPQSSFVCREGPQSFDSTDSHSIYDGEIEVARGRVTLHRIEFRERRYPFSRVGNFQSSDQGLNRLWCTCVRALEIASEDAYIDCTDRERVEWMDTDPPVFDVTRVAMSGPGDSGEAVYSDPRLMETMLRRTALTIQPEGWVKAHTCSDRFDIHAKMEDRSCNWIEGARRYYDATGKTEVIKEIWPAIVRQMDYFLERRSPRGLVIGREWTVWGNPLGYSTCEPTTLNAFVSRSLLDAAYLGRKVGKGKDAARLEAAGKILAETINRVLWCAEKGTYYAGYYDPSLAGELGGNGRTLSRNGPLFNPTRHAALFMLDQGLVPEERMKSTTDYLRANPPHENDIMQYYYYWKFLYRQDDPVADQEVLDVMRKEWQDMAESPYEATFEGLHSWGSKAHSYGLFPAYFLSSYVLGVRREGATILVEPRLGDLTQACGTVSTEFGPVSVQWHRDGDHGSFEVVSPDNLKLVLRIPKGSPRLDAYPDRHFTDRGRWSEVTLAGGRYRGSW